jgi:hypothetical protein
MSDGPSSTNPAAIDLRYVAARRVLLDALSALAPQDRVDDGPDSRRKDKDAADVIRLMRSTSAREVGETLAAIRLRPDAPAASDPAALPPPGPASIPGT